MCLDITYLTGFIRSVAMARATQSHTRVQWVEYKDSSVLNFIYTVMPWKGTPGWVEIDTGLQSTIKSDAARYIEQYQRTLIRKTEDGPQATATYLLSLEQTRADCLRMVQEVFSDAGKLNTEVIKEARNGIRTLATIKLVSDVAVATVAPFWLDLTYSVVTTGIKEASTGTKADVIAFKVSGTAAKEGAEEGMEQLSKAWGARADEIGKEVAELESKIAERGAALAKKAKLGKKGQHTIRKTIQHLKQDAVYVEKSQKMPFMKKKLFKGLKFAFVAADVIDAFGEFKGTWENSE